MPTAPTIDVESLVQPVPGDDPAGGPLPGPAGEKLKEFREEFDPDDLEARAGSYEWLDDEKGGALYPNKLKTVPILVSGAMRVSVITWKGFQGQAAEVTWDQIAAAARASDPKKSQAVLDDITEMM